MSFDSTSPSTAREDSVTSSNNGVCSDLEREDRQSSVTFTLLRGPNKGRSRGSFEDRQTELTGHPRAKAYYVVTEGKQPTLGLLSHSQSQISKGSSSSEDTFAADYLSGHNRSTASIEESFRQINRLPLEVFAKTSQSHESIPEDEPEQSPYDLQ